MNNSPSSGISLGIDLGGTKILAVVIDCERKILARAKSNTPADVPAQEVCRQMHETAAKALMKAELDWPRVAHLGIAIPASVDPATGDALHAPALGWRNQPIKAMLEDIFKRPVSLSNDVNSGTIAEALLGAGRGCGCVVGYFVGTGLGGGIVINGKLHTGLRGAAAELGHEIVRAGGELCGCGKKGCVEAYCSKTAFCREFNERINKRGQSSIMGEIAKGDFSDGIKSKMLSKAYLAEDKVTRKIVDRGMKMLGIACANMMSILGPDCIILGGGVMESLGEELLPVVRKYAVRNLFAYAPEDIDLRLSVLGDDAVPLGAALISEN